MKFSEFNQIRVRDVNSKPYNEKGKYILYWMQAYRRIRYNHALDYAINLAEKNNMSLVIYEGLRMNYPWASKRFHKFILEGFIDNSIDAEKLGVAYWPFVETPENKDNELLKKISQESFAIVTDDFPCFIIPNHIQKVAEKSDYKVIAVDSNSITPLAKYGDTPSAARILRPRIHLNFSESFIHKSNQKPSFDKIQYYKSKPPFKLFICRQEEIDKVLSKISFKNEINPTPSIVGGRKEALKILGNFLKKKLHRYSVDRSNPNSPEEGVSSLLSPYIHFGHISIDEIVTEVLNIDGKKWAPDLINFSKKGKREDFFHKEEFVNSFLDEILTWREIGFLMFFNKREFNKTLDVLPNWVKENNKKHASDKRSHIYTKDILESSKTHDKLWNAAQRELVITGRMHNYMRMLWGKKVIEWTRSYEEAFDILEDFNNKYAYDGRDPNSYTGILWCFGLFDRPWFPERPVYGMVRYMSSDSTMKKFKMNPYLDYVSKLSGNKETLFG